MRRLSIGLLNTTSVVGAVSMPWIFQFSVQILGNNGPLYSYAILNLTGFLISTLLEKETFGLGEKIDRQT